MKVIFVGIHNKEDMMPLDILSKSGKIIHKIEKELSISAIKTNLYDMERMPIGNEIDNEPVKWWYKNNIEIDYDCIIVLLGKFVQDNFYKAHNDCKYINLAHPASSLFHGNKSTEQYVNNAVDKIKPFLTLNNNL
jgi:hypothetical protein